MPARHATAIPVRVALTGCKPDHRLTVLLNPYTYLQGKPLRKGAESLAFKI